MNSSISNFKLGKFRIIFLILFSITIFFILDRSIYIVFRHISGKFYDRPPQNSINMNIGKIEKKFYDTLIMGSSRTRQGIHPLYLKENLGIKAKKIAASGKYPRYHYRYYKIFRKKFKIPDIVIYGVDYFIFDWKSNLKKMKRLLGFELNKKYKKPFKIEPKLFNPFDPPSLLLKNQGKINNFFIDVLDQLQEEHQKAEGLSLIDDNIGNKSTARNINIIEPFKWEKIKYSCFPGNEGKFFILLLDELLKDNVKVFLIIIPDIIGVYSTNFERDKFEKEIKSLSSKYPNVVVLNYNDPEKFDIKNPKFFRDGNYGEVLSHLSFYGAKELNKLLCRDIKKIINSEGNQIPEK